MGVLSFEGIARGGVIMKLRRVLNGEKAPSMPKAATIYCMDEQYIGGMNAKAHSSRL